VKKMDELSRRKFLKQFAVFSAGMGVVIIAGCEPFLEYGPVPAYGPTPVEPDPSDPFGNLYVRSNSMRELVLYDNYSRPKILRFINNYYRVGVQRNDPEENELEIFGYMSVRGDLDNPQKSKMLKRWSVNLPTELSETPNYIWIIDNYLSKECGELVLTYQSGSDIKVDVKMINWEGTHSEQILPGQLVHLGISFGEYRIEYSYWRGNTPKAGERNDLGRITTEIVDGEEVPITVNLNADNSKIERTIPNWEG